MANLTISCINSMCLRIFLVLFFLGLQTAVADQPDWFLKPSINSYELLGYGQDTRLDKAKDMAFKDIIQTIKVEVSSSTNITKTLQNESFDNKVIQNLNTSSSAVLLGARVKQAKQVDGVWFVSVVYDTGTIAAKFKRSFKGRKLKDEKSNYLSITGLISNINKKVGKSLRYELIRKNDLWMLRYKDIEHVLSESDLIKLFTFHSDKSIKLNLNKKIFYPQDQMKFQIKSNNTGYISMLYVESNGKVGVLFENQKSHSKTNYPAKNSDIELTVANPSKKVLHEMYVALWSQNKLNLTPFEDVQNDYLDSSNFKFNELIRLLDQVNYGSVVVKIKF